MGGLGSWSNYLVRKKFCIGKTYDILSSFSSKITASWTTECHVWFALIKSLSACNDYNKVRWTSVKAK